jgi:hypothetical protein
MFYGWVQQEVCRGQKLFLLCTVAKILSRIQVTQQEINGF